MKSKRFLTLSQFFLITITVICIFIITSFIFFYEKNDSDKHGIFVSIQEQAYDNLY